MPTLRRACQEHHRPCGDRCHGPSPESGATEFLVEGQLVGYPAAAIGGGRHCTSDDNARHAQESTASQ